MYLVQHQFRKKVAAGFENIRDTQGFSNFEGEKALAHISHDMR
jgi:hypothetical protein